MELHVVVLCLAVIVSVLLMIVIKNLFVNRIAIMKTVVVNCMFSYKLSYVMYFVKTTVASTLAFTFIVFPSVTVNPSGMQTDSLPK